MRATTFTTTGLRALLAVALGLAPVLVLAGPASASDYGEGPQPPWSVGDMYVTDQDVQLDSRRTGHTLLDNDSKYGAVYDTVVSEPTHGTVELVEDGSTNGHIVYTPDLGFNGVDTFTYSTFSTDDWYHERPSGPSTVTVLVRPAERALVTAPDRYTATAGEDLVVAAPGYLANDSSPDSLPLSQSWISPVTVGTVVQPADGSFVYTPPAGFTGAASFTYAVTDGVAHSAPQTVTIEVVDSTPVAVDDAYELDEDTPLVASSVLTNDFGPAGRPDEASTVTDPEHGTLAFAPDGTFTYTPDLDFAGTDSFTYVAKDGSAESEPATVTLTVASVEDFLPVAVDDAYTTDQDLQLDARNVARGLFDNDDLDAVGTATIVDSTTHGTVSLSPQGRFDYYPEPGFHGTDSFTYTVTTSSVSNVATVTLTVRPADRALIATPDSYETPAGVALTVDAPGLLANDVSPDGLPLQSILYHYNTGYYSTGGRLSVASDGSFVYTPAPGYQGADRFTYVVYDGLGYTDEVTVSIRVVGEGPAARDDSYGVTEDDVYTSSWSVLANDDSPAGKPLTATKLTDTEHGTVTMGSDGVFVYTPDKDFNGPDSFTYEASDGTIVSAPATVRISVRAVDELPEFDPLVVQLETVENTPLSGKVTAINVDNLPLQYGVYFFGYLKERDTVPGGSVTVSSSGSYVFTPADEFVGLAQIKISACTRLFQCATQRLDITVTAAPRAPVMADQTVQTFWGRSVTGALDVTDVDSPTLALAVTTAPQRGTVVLDTQAQTFVYTPAWWSTADDAFVVEACDPGGLCGSATVTVDLRRSWWMTPPRVSALSSLFGWLDRFVVMGR
ncbi:hypothetical protein ATL42_2386 [Sanguibacter antarcticus]|uniref:Tandem-95 repeat protein n=1 Tax=Sanguibacter antarcticus TaxID=372484 RepID=A0A2A9E758_9MICO|nr:hypothetical protein ATL42_2386 [Sanguibacter antarcticus]